MPLKPLDYEAKYRARQLRLGAWVAVGLTILGGIRIMVDRQASRWMARRSW